MSSAPTAEPPLETRPFEAVDEIRGVEYPAGTRFRQIIVTGPPGSGKSRLVKALRGWPEEGFIDVTQPDWWRDKQFSLRPREVHIGFPFAGHDEGLAVTDDEWLAKPGRLERGRVVIPPPKRRWFNTNWRDKYLFDVQLPSPEALLEGRRERGRVGLHPRDRNITLDQVRREWSAYAVLAQHFTASGLQVLVRRELLGKPERVV